jgi:hypothetical protein
VYPWRSYSPAVEALHRTAWEDVTVEGAESIGAFLGLMAAPFPGRPRHLGGSVHAAAAQIGHKARRRLAQAGEHPRAIHDAATPVRGS